MNSIGVPGASGAADPLLPNSGQQCPVATNSKQSAAWLMPFQTLLAYDKSGLANQYTTGTAVLAYILEYTTLARVSCALSANHGGPSVHRRSKVGARYRAYTVQHTQASDMPSCQM